jgi:hypothetical protein
VNVFRAFFVVLIIFLAANLGGCCGGSDVRTENKSISTTLGGELKDLRDAYDQGIISEKEYNAAREKLLKQRTKDD